MITRRFLVAAICGLFLGTGSTVGYGQANPPEQFVATVGKRAIDSLTVKTISDQERETRFRKILRESFDVPEIGKFVLGRYWRTATEPERTEYIRLFEEFIIQAYAKRFADYAGEQFKVGHLVASPDSDKLVSSEIIQPHGQPAIRLVWRLRPEADDFKIVDVSVEGISMSVTQRDEFAAVIRSSSGKVSGLIDALKKKTGK
jgi:phospholipid transport system substrate-binding protein